MPTSLVLTSGWKELANTLDPKKFSKKLGTSVAYANRLNAAILQHGMRRTIKAGVPPPNAALTIMIKGSSKPLVDSGQLFQSVATQVINQYTSFVGILATSDVYNIAMAVHEGSAIKVTDAMRGLFMVLWKASTGQISPGSLDGRAAELWARKPGGWFPLRPETTVINIPSRPFVRIAFEDAASRAKIQSNWDDAVRKALKVEPG